MGAGVGFQFSSKYETPGMEYALDKRDSKVDIPIFANVHLNFLKKRLSPFVDLKGGAYFNNTDNSPKRKINWIDYMVPNLVNVAVTRARQTLCVVGNADYIKAVSPEHNALGYLVRYAQTKTK